MNGALSSTMKSRRIQPLLPGRSAEKGSVHDAAQWTQPKNALTVCHNSAKLDDSFRKGITIDVETFSGGKSRQNVMHPLNKLGTGRRPWWKKSTDNFEYPDTSFRDAPRENKNELDSRHELSHFSDTPGRPTSFSTITGNVDHLGHSFRIVSTYLGSTTFAMLCAHLPSYSETATFGLKATQKKDKESRRKNFLSRSLSNISSARPTSLSKSMDNFERKEKSFRIATDKNREDARCSGQDFSRQYSNPIGGRPAWLSKSVGNVEQLDSSFRISSRKRPKDSRRKNNIPYPLSTSSHVAPTSLSSSIGSADYLDNSFKLEPQKKSAQSLRAQSGGRPTSLSKSMGNVESLDKSFKLARHQQQKEVRNTKHSLQWTPSGGRPTPLSKSLGNVEYLDSSFRIASQKKAKASTSRKGAPNSFSTANGRRPTSLSKSTGNGSCLDNSFQLVSRYIGMTGFLMHLIFPLLG
eukprot:CCRYP_000539-RD/>CCRYP_000539-RD protein AED:0.37 eAED:0.37 QI:116/1/1/1/1/1/7/89/464